MTPSRRRPTRPSQAKARHSLLSRLYTGTGAFEVVGRRKI